MDFYSKVFRPSDSNRTRYYTGAPKVYTGQRYHERVRPLHRPSHCYRPSEHSPVDDCSPTSQGTKRSQSTGHSRHDTRARSKSPRRPSHHKFTSNKHHDTHKRSSSLRRSASACPYGSPPPPPPSSPYFSRQNSSARSSRPAPQAKYGHDRHQTNRDRSAPSTLRKHHNAGRTYGPPSRGSTSRGRQRTTERPTERSRGRSRTRNRHHSRSRSRSLSRAARRVRSMRRDDDEVSEKTMHFREMTKKNTSANKRVAEAIKNKHLGAAIKTERVGAATATKRGAVATKPPEMRLRATSRGRTAKRTAPSRESKSRPPPPTRPSTPTWVKPVHTPCSDPIMYAPRAAMRREPETRKSLSKPVRKVKFN